MSEKVLLIDGQEKQQIHSKLTEILNRITKLEQEKTYESQNQNSIKEIPLNITQTAIFFKRSPSWVTDNIRPLKERDLRIEGKDLKEANFYKIDELNKYAKEIEEKNKNRYRDRLKNA